MTKMTKRLALLALAATIAAPTVASAATIHMFRLPILVDRFYELKHPAGPVTRTVPETLQKGIMFYQLHPELKDIPMPDPRMDRILIGL